jgi:malonate transporter and related proteins
VIETLNAITPVFLIIVIGYLLHRAKIVGNDVWSAIEHICFYLLFPFLIIRTLSRANLSSVPVGDFLVVLVVAALGMAVLLLVARSGLKRSGVTDPTFSSIFQGATRFHGFMALAIVGPLYGDDGVTLAAIALAVMVPMLNFINVIMLSLYGSGAEAQRLGSILLRVIQNPLILACGVGLIMNMTGIPDFIFNTVEIVGSGGLGLALLTAGAGLKLGHAVGNAMLLGLGVLIRMLGMPMIVLGMCWLVELDGLPRTIAIISGAVPTASSAYVMARKMGGDAELMSNLVTFQVVVSFITLPMFIYLAERL